MKRNYPISTDKSKLDIALIHDYLCNRSYWAKGRTLAAVKRSVDHSLCFGLYTKKGSQIGFARVITDYTVFAYLLDVFILEPYRGRGLGKRLINHILNHPELLDVRRWSLSTLDAHGLYLPYGFEGLKNPENQMEKKKQEQP